MGINQKVVASDATLVFMKQHPLSAERYLA